MYEGKPESAWINPLYSWMILLSHTGRLKMQKDRPGVETRRRSVDYPASVDYDGCLRRHRPYVAGIHGSRVDGDGGGIDLNNARTTDLQGVRAPDQQGIRTLAPLRGARNLGERDGAVVDHASRARYG